jgi:hypothetical protein
MGYDLEQSQLKKNIIDCNIVEGIEMGSNEEKINLASWRVIFIFKVRY